MGTLGITGTPQEYAKNVLSMEDSYQIPSPTAASWTDLLGFSSHLDHAQWNLDDENSKIPISRLLKLAHEVRSHSQPYQEEGIFINDGVIRTCSTELYQADPSERHNFLTWLESCIITHCIITGLEQDHSLPGLRTVICQGQSLVYSKHPDVSDKSGGAAP